MLRVLEMASADLGLNGPDLTPLDSVPFDENAAWHSDEEGLVNQNAISSDHEEAGLAAERDANEAADHDPKFQLVATSTEPGNNEPVAENQGSEAQILKSGKEPNPYLCYFSGKPEKFRSFCRMYQIPTDVEVRLVHHENVVFTPKHITVPFLAITEGGLRFPMNPFLHQFLFEYQLNPRFLEVNAFRIINNIHALKEKFNLPFIVQI